jgi:hypothetical protein
MLRYDKMLFTVYPKPTARKSSKALSKKSAKSFPAKKSAKLPELSRAAVGLGLLYLFDYLYLTYIQLF